MITLRFLDDEVRECILDVLVVEKSDILPLFDKHIRSVEVENGWWELWNINGRVCGYFEEDE